MQSFFTTNKSAMICDFCLLASHPRPSSLALISNLSLPFTASNLVILPHSRDSPTIPRDDRKLIFIEFSFRRFVCLNNWLYREWLSFEYTLNYAFNAFIHQWFAIQNLFLTKTFDLKNCCLKFSQTKFASLMPWYATQIPHIRCTMGSDLLHIWHIVR